MPEIGAPRGAGMPSKRGRRSLRNASSPGASGDPAEAAVVSPKILGQHEWYARERQPGKI